MKQLIYLLSFSLLWMSCKSVQKTTLLPYQQLADETDKVLIGELNRPLIENDSAFIWLKENMKWGFADAAAVKAFKEKANLFEIVVVCGTWCGDTKNLLPSFYRLIDKSGFPDQKIKLLGVDRSKTMPVDIVKKYNITEVPTFIIYSKGKEVGRVIEYGKDGILDKELGEIVAKLY